MSACSPFQLTTGVRYNVVMGTPLVRRHSLAFRQPSKWYSSMKFLEKEKPKRSTHTKKQERPKKEAIAIKS